MKNPTLVLASTGEKKLRLTYPQRLLLQLIRKKLLDSMSITKRDIALLYINAVKKKKFYVWQELIYSHHKDSYYYTGKSSIVRWIDDPKIYVTAQRWFKSNIGACIVKGKVLILPEIEV